MGLKEHLFVSLLEISENNSSFPVLGIYCGHSNDLSAFHV